MKIYIVKQSTYDFYNGSYCGTEVLGYFLNKEKAETVADENKADKYHTTGNAFVEEAEITE